MVSFLVFNVMLNADLKTLYKLWHTVVIEPFYQLKINKPSI